jgi:hypothetical protein
MICEEQAKDLSSDLPSGMYCRVKKFVDRRFRGTCCLHQGNEEAARTSETSVDNYFTRQYIPEDKFELHTRRRENLKSHKAKDCFCTQYVIAGSLPTRN